jgi:pSer/pThr/pTyr-binding forkhead associated (FHA) protein
MSGLAGPHSASAAELKERLAAERAGEPFLILRDGAGTQRLIALAEGGDRLTVGRSHDCDVPLDWDEQVSRVHAELEHVGPGWAISDGGLSRNGTFHNGERVTERRRLSDGDTLRLGGTAIVFRQPAKVTSATTVFARDRPPGPSQVTPAQRQVLRALCRPFAQPTDGEAPRPATNHDIAEELFLSVDAVKGHLRLLFAKFELDAVPQNEKRLRLAERALQAGAVTLAELRPPREQ